MMSLNLVLMLRNPLRKTIFASWLIFSTAANAGLISNPQEFSIPGGDLKSALDAYIAQSHRQLIYARTDVTGLSTKGMTGKVTPEEALQRLISGSHLQTQTDASGVTIVFREAANNLAKSPVKSRQYFSIPAGVLVATIDAIAAASHSKIDYPSGFADGLEAPAIEGGMTVPEALKIALNGAKMSTIKLAENHYQLQFVENDSVVEVRGSASHLANSSSTGSRMDVDPITLPMSIESLNYELLSEQQVQNVSDMVDNIPGVASDASTGSYVIRGFNATVIQNGIANAGTYIFSTPLSAIDHIEVVKGPQAIIGGLGFGYGGVINIITKTPQSTPVHDVSLQFGSSGHEELSLDLAGPLNEDKSLTYRLVVSQMSDGKDRVGYDGAWRHYLAPSIEYKYRPTGTDILLTHEKNLQRITPYDNAYYLPGQAIGNSLHPFRIDSPVDGQSQNNSTTELKIRQTLNDNWELTGVYNYQNQKTLLSANLAGFLDFTGTLPANLYTFPNVIEYAEFDFVGATLLTKRLELRGEFDTGSVHHTLLFAYDHVNKIQNFTIDSGKLYSANLQTSAHLDVSAYLGGAYTFVAAPYETIESGKLVMDRLKWDAWNVLVGIRDINFSNGDVSFRHWLPALGVLYQVTPNLSLYGSYSETFIPSSSPQYYGTETQSPSGKIVQGELGFKALFLNKAIAFTGSLFQINQKNAALRDFIHSDNVGSIIGSVGQVSQGMELELSGNLTQHFNIRTSYSYTDTWLAGEQTVYQFLNFLPPKHKLSLWGTYALNGNEGLETWFGGGVRTQSRIFLGDFGVGYGNEYQPSNTRIDIAAGYRKQTWSVVAGIKNLMNRTLILNNASGSATLDQARTLHVTFKHHF